MEDIEVRIDKCALLLRSSRPCQLLSVPCQPYALFDKGALLLRYPRPCEGADGEAKEGEPGD